MEDSIAKALEIEPKSEIISSNTAINQTVTIVGEEDDYDIARRNIKNMQEKLERVIGDLMNLSLTNNSDEGMYEQLNNLMKTYMDSNKHLADMRNNAIKRSNKEENKEETHFSLPTKKLLEIISELGKK